MDDAVEYFAKQLKKIRDEKGWSQKELAERANLSSGLIGLYELGKRDPRRKNMKKLADALDVDDNYFIDYSFLDNRLELNSTNELTKMPVVILGIASCGEGTNNEHTIHEYIDLPKEWTKGGVYGAYASGDSMVGAGIVDGSLLLIKDQQSLDNGQIGVFYYKGENFIKKYKKIGSTVLLQSANSSYEDIEVKKGDEFRIIARVTRIVTELL